MLIDKEQFIKKANKLGYAKNYLRIKLYLSSNHETLYTSPKQLPTSSGEAGKFPGQYSAKLSSLALEAVVAYMFILLGRSPSNMLPDSHASKYITFFRLNGIMHQLQYLK